MQSPLIPSLGFNIDAKIKSLTVKEIEVLLICGEKDEDCLPLSRLFAFRARELGFMDKDLEKRCIFTTTQKIEMDAAQMGFLDASFDVVTIFFTLLSHAP